MFTIDITKTPFEQTQADAKIVFVIAKELNHRWIKDKEALELVGFKGESEEAIFFPSNKIIYVGCDSLDADEIRLAASKALDTIKKSTVRSLAIGTYTDECPGMNIKALDEGFMLGGYAFTTYKSKKEECKLKTITISIEDYVLGKLLQKQPILHVILSMAHHKTLPLLHWQISQKV